MPSATVVLAVAVLSPGLAQAATIAPPMLDISRQCDASTRHNVIAMSECVVAESEARAEILQKWERLSDSSAEKCVKEGRKSRKFPYSTIAKCLAVEPVGLPQASAPPVAADGATAASSTTTFSGWKQFFSSGKSSSAPPAAGESGR